MGVDGLEPICETLHVAPSTYYSAKARPLHGGRRNAELAPRLEDLRQRDFSASSPEETWVIDFTYGSTWSGVVYVAFVCDCFSRCLVGWKARTMTATLVLDALKMPAWTRRGRDLAGLACHSDAGRVAR